RVVLDHLGATLFDEALPLRSDLQFPRLYLTDRGDEAASSWEGMRTAMMTDRRQEFQRAVLAKYSFARRRDKAQRSANAVGVRI
ncbi:hypothetical protein OAS39_13250, partial [Pirellulales bacterium]|nr:hypothetical protein [Pirellulales bacterium]